MREFATALGRALHRPSFAKVPAAVLRLALGEMAAVVLDGSARRAEEGARTRVHVPLHGRPLRPEGRRRRLMALVGRSIPRSDGPAKVTGRARYVDDVTRPGTLVGATLRSTVARGRLRGIEKDSSFDWTGITVVTAENVPANVVALIEEDQPVLAADDIRHAGEPLALVAGEDALRVQRALRHLRADIEPLPPVLTVPDALARTAQIYGSDNVFRTVHIAKGDAAAAIAACPVQLVGDVHDAPPGAHLHRAAGRPRVLGRGRRRARSLVVPVPVLHPQGNQAHLRAHGRARGRDAGGDGRRLRRQGGVPDDPRAARAAPRAARAAAPSRWSTTGRRTSRRRRSATPLP